MPAIANDTFLIVRSSFEALGKAVAFLDNDLRIVDASPALCTLLNTPAPEGRLLADLMDAQPLLDAMRAGRRGDRQCSTPRGQMLHVTGAKLAERMFDSDARYLICIDVETEAGEPERILRALEANRWRRSAAARALGISRATLWRRMRDFGML